MKKIVLTFGLISGGVLAAMGAAMWPLCHSGTIEPGDSQIVGYASMVLAFLLVFFGIRSYRENVGGGTITFGRAFKVGILITLITCAIYVIAWEVTYYGFMPDFGDKYATYALEKMRADGASDAELLKAQQQMAQFKELYKNPLFNIGMTFLEVFPVGLIVTLVSAAILRRKTPPATPAVATA
jgi:hypothetical protein